MDSIVVDLGCGYGDLALSAVKAGASQVIAVDKDWHLVQMAFQKSTPEYFGKMTGHQLDITPEVVRYFADFCFIGMMTSVLPYLDNPTEILKAATGFPLFFLECQYAGDGPGFKHIKDHHYMANWLEDCGFIEYGIIGHTMVEDRNARRDIWACSATDQVFGA